MKGSFLKHGYFEFSNLTR